VRGVRQYVRGRLETIYDILLFCEEPIGFTRLLNQVGMPCARSAEFLDFLVEKGLLKWIPSGVKRPKRLLVLTDSGYTMLRLFREIYSQLGLGYERKPAKLMWRPQEEAVK